MSISNYTAKCEEFLYELETSLSKKDMEELKAYCVQIGFDKCDDWFWGNLQIISEYVRYTPSKRNKKKEWQDKKLRQFLVFQAMRYVYMTRNFLEAASHPELFPGPSYRDLISKGGLIYSKLLASNYIEWPFRNEESPFDPGKDKD